MSDDDLLAALRRVRHDYAAERIWHKFLLDAYAGTGGFMGRVRLPFSGYWGAASEIYASNNIAVDTLSRGVSEHGLDTYLERYPREDIEKFARRHYVSQYPNYIEPIIDIRMSFMHRKDFQRIDVDEGVEAWMDDVDGTGQTWEMLRQETVDFRAALLGWCPVLFDRTRIDGDDIGTPISVAQAEQLGVRVNAIPLFPANLLDWDVDERGEFVWVKTASAEIHRPDPLGPSTNRARFTIWTRHSVQRYIVTHNKESKPTTIEAGPEEPHGFGRVPILIARHKRAHDSPVRGLPMAGGSSLMARKVFNYLSELDEHIGSSVFAFLQVPRKKTGEDAGEIVLGSGNALALDMTSSRDYKYISPDASVATTLESRITTTVEEIYRVGRTEFARATTAGGGPESGTARAFAFENTNRAISDFAANVGRFDEAALQFVAQLQTGNPLAGEDIRVVPPQRFDVEEMSRAIDEALSAISLDIGPTAESELKKRLVSKLLPNLTPDLTDVITEELEGLRALGVSANAFGEEQESEPTANAHQHADPLPDAEGDGQATGPDIVDPDSEMMHNHERPNGEFTEMAEYGEGHTHETSDGPTGPNGVEIGLPNTYGDSKGRTR